MCVNQPDTTMLIHINLNGKYQLAKVLEFNPRYVQLPCDYVCGVYIRFQLLNSKKIDNTLFIDHVNWHPVNQKQFNKKMYQLKVPTIKTMHGNFIGFRQR